MPLDSCKAELSSSEELPEDGGDARASSVLPGAASILAALPPSPVCGCRPLAEPRSVSPPRLPPRAPGAPTRARPRLSRARCPLPSLSGSQSPAPAL